MPLQWECQAAARAGGHPSARSDVRRIDDELGGYKFVGEAKRLLAGTSRRRGSPLRSATARRWLVPCAGVLSICLVGVEAPAKPPGARFTPLTALGDTNEPARDQPNQRASSKTERTSAERSRRSAQPFPRTQRVQALVARAKALRLAQSRGWLRLLHYRLNLWGNRVSDLDSDEFFLAKDGKRDAQAELEATLDAFFASASGVEDNQHATCRFPARLFWLERRLGFKQFLPAAPCPALELYEARLRPRSVSVVFSTNSLNHPASAFGHTFLRVHRQPNRFSPWPGERRDFGVDFRAATDTNNPILYAFKGLTGLFRGEYQVHAFEDLVSKYADFETRDLWEYQLVLRPNELRTLTLHLFELTKSYMDYFYLTENCSYQILALLEAAAPRLELLRHVKTLVYPADTIKALYAEPGLVRSVVYHPSRRSRLRSRIFKASAEERELIQLLLDDPTAQVPPSTPSQVLAAAIDTALLVLEMRFADQLNANGQNEVSRSYDRLLERRATLPQPKTLVNVAKPDRKRPELGHGTSRVMTGVGASTQNHDGFFSLGYRLALHDLLDPPDGQPELAQVQMLNAEFRWELLRRQFTLESIVFAELMSLSPVRSFEPSLSWRVRAHGRRVRDAGCESRNCFAHGVDGALGWTLASSNEHIAAFAMANTYLLFSGQFEGVGGSFVRWGLGPYGGLRLHLPGQTVAAITGSWSYLPFQKLWSTFIAHGQLRAPLARDVALGLGVTLQPSAFEGQLASYIYF